MEGSGIPPRLQSVTRRSFLHAGKAALATRGAGSLTEAESRIGESRGCRPQ
jgi:hypothetical protein